MMLAQFNVLEPLTYYLIVVNFVTFAAFGIDKSRAEAGSYRLSEALLLRLAAIGGTPGAWAGRSLFRHKTRKTSFNDQLVGVMFVQIVAIVVIGYVIPWQPAADESANTQSNAEEVGAVHYRGCNEVRAAGKDPLYRGDPAYRKDMDGDMAGIACEPIA